MSQLRVIVTSGVTKYLGEIDEKLAPTRPEDLAHCTTMQLTNVRELFSFMSPVRDPDGRGSGVSRNVMLVPVGLCIGPLSKLFVRVDSIHFPDDDPELKESLNKLLRAAESQEMATRAHASGIELAGIMPPGRSVQ